MRYITLYAILGQAWCLLLPTVDMATGETMETALSDVLVFIVVFVTVICIMHSPMYRRLRGTRPQIRTEGAEHTDRPAADLPICPSCNRRYRPVRDAEGHMICQWCGHFEGR